MLAPFLLATLLLANAFGVSYSQCAGNTGCAGAATTGCQPQSQSTACRILCPVQQSGCTPVQTPTCPPVQQCQCQPVTTPTCPPVQIPTCPPVPIITCPPIPPTPTCPPQIQCPVCPPIPPTPTCPPPVQCQVCPQIPVITCPPVQIPTCPPPTTVCPTPPPLYIQCPTQPACTPVQQPQCNPCPATQTQYVATPCQCPCYGKKSRRFARNIGIVGGGNNETSSCNDEHLQKIMIDNISDMTTESQNAIEKAAELRYKAKFGVICAKNPFFITIDSRLFCRHSVGKVTCFAFRH